MLEMVKYLNLPTLAGVGIIGLYLALNIGGELMELMGKVVPEFFKIRKYFARKKKERETIAALQETLPELMKSLAEFNAHYNADNIKMRDDWMRNVNEKLQDHDSWKEEFSKKLDKNSAITLDNLIENLRSSIISFAAHVIDENTPVTREQFTRIFKMYAKYEAILEENDMTNGEADVAMRIINESYEYHMRHHSFIEDIRGYGSTSQA